ncbi:MAG: hypothetical protein ABI416_05215 [Ginsengibacter sp.]
MDFAFDPRSTRYDKLIRQMFSFRKDTTVIQEKWLNTVEDFFKHLASHVSTPLTNILLGSHGNESAQMALLFIDGFGFTSFEALDVAVNGLRRKCQLENNIINPRPLDPANQPIPAFIYIKGCRIGIAVPFLNKIKEVVNGLSSTPISVSAPKFYYEMYDKMPKGIFEFFIYDFHAYMNKRFKSKAALLAELSDKVKYNYKDIHGNVITDAQFLAWVPTDIHKTRDPLLNVNLNPTPVTGFASLPGGRYKFEVTTILTWLVDSTISKSKLPTNKAGIPAFLKKQLKDRAANPTGPDDDFAPMLLDTHPFPFHVRNGYKSIDELVDGLDWIPSKDFRTYNGNRYEYSVSPPITLNNANNELVFNFYAAPSGGVTSSSMFDDKNSTFFQVV